MLLSYNCKNNDRFNRTLWNIGDIYEKNSSTSQDVGGLIVAVAASVKFRNIHTRNSRLIGLLEVLLIDETSKDNTLLFQSWGQTASDHHRFAIQNGDLLILDSVSLTLRSDGLFIVRGDLLYCAEAGSAIDHSVVNPWFPSALIRKLTGLSTWCTSDPLMVLVRARPPVVATVASLADIAASVDVQLFSLLLHISVEQTMHDNISVPQQVRSLQLDDCMDATGARVVLQCESLEQYQQLSSTVRMCASRAPPALKGGGRVWLRVISVCVGSSYHGTIQRLRAHAGTTFVALDCSSTETASISITKKKSCASVQRVREAVEVMSWAELKAVLSDSRMLVAHSDSLKAVRCALADVFFESDKHLSKGSPPISTLEGMPVMRNIRIVRPSVGADSISQARKRSRSVCGGTTTTTAVDDKHRSGDVRERSSGDDSDRYLGGGGGVHVSYRDVRVVLGAPTDFTMSCSQQRTLRERYTVQPTAVVRPVGTTQTGAAPTQSHWGTCTDSEDDAAATTQQQYMRVHWYSAPQSCPHSLPSSSYNAHSDLVSAVLHDAALTRALGGITAAQVAVQVSKARLRQQQNQHTQNNEGCSSRLDFDFVGAVSRTVAALKAGAESQRDCLFVLRLCPVLDENGMVAADCVFSVEDIIA